MAAMDKTLLKDIFDSISAVNVFLTQDLSKESLSNGAHLRRQHLAHSVDTILKKINSTHPSIRPRVNTPGSMPQPPPPAPKPSPLIPPQMEEEEEGQDMYEEAIIISQPNPEDYLDFEVGQEGPQEEYLDMEAGEDRVEEETYEDPAQTMLQGEEGQDVYEEPQPQQSSITIIPPSPPTTSSFPTQPPSSSNEPDIALLESTAVGNSGHRNSMALSEADWSDAYDTNTKKADKIRVSELGNVTHRGWLEKLGGRNQKNWQKRFCVVSGVFMYFYEKENSRTYNNRIALPQYVPNPANELTNQKKKHFAVKLSAAEPTKQSKDYFFRLSSDEERTKWIDALRDAFELSRIGGLDDHIMRVACTMPRMPSSSSSTSLLHHDQVKLRAASTGEMDQEEYEAVTAVFAEEEEEQDDYVAVTANSELPVEDGPEEDYVDLQPTEREILEEEIEEEPDRPTQPHLPHHPQSARGPPQLPPHPQSARGQPQLPPLPQSARGPPQLPPLPQSARGQPQLPPLPSSARGQPQLPPLPKAPQQPLPPPPSSSISPRNYTPRPDPPVDTNRDYCQQPNGVQFNKVYMMLWDFAATEKDEIDLKRGDLIFVTDNKERQVWWFGELVDSNVTKRLGPKGLFPASYSSVAFQLVQ